MPGLKTGVKNFIFWSEIGSGFREPAAHPHHEFPGRRTPLPRVSTPAPTTHPTKQSNLMGKRTFLNIQAKDVLISYQITLQIFLFIHFRSTIYISHTPSLYLTLIFNIYVRVCQRFQFHGIYVNSSVYAFISLLFLIYFLYPKFHLG